MKIKLMSVIKNICLLGMVIISNMCAMQLSKRSNFPNKERYQWAKDVYDYQKCLKFNECIRKEPTARWLPRLHEDIPFAPRLDVLTDDTKPLSITMIYKFKEAIELIDSLVKNARCSRDVNSRCLSLENIKQLASFFCATSSGDKYVQRSILWLKTHLRNERFLYCHHKTYTIENFKINKSSLSKWLINPSSWSPLVIFGNVAWIALSLCRHMELRYPKVIDPDIVLKNEAGKALNSFIEQSKFSNSLVDLLYIMQDPLVYSWFDWCKVKSPCLFPLPVVYLLFLFIESPLKMDNDVLRMFGLVGMLCSAILLYISYANNLDFLFPSMGSILFINFCYIVKIVLDMKKWRHKLISWNAIESNFSDLVKKHDEGHIVIK